MGGVGRRIEVEMPHRDNHALLLAQLMEFAPPGTTPDQILEMSKKFREREKLKEEICKLWDGECAVALENRYEPHMV